MNAVDLPLTIDITTGTLIRDFNTTVQTSLPELFASDKINLMLRAVTPTRSPELPWRDVSLADGDLRVGLGVPGADFTSGTFTVSWGGFTTSALAYNISASALETALNALTSISAAGGVDVIGAAGGAYRITFRSNGARAELSIGTTELFPIGTAYVDRVVEGDPSTKEVQLLSLEVSTLAFAQTFTSFPSAAITVTTLVAGTTGVNEIQQVDISSPEPYGGNFSLTFDGETTAAIPHSATASEVAAALEALTNIGTGNVSVTGSFPLWFVEFTGTLAGANQPQMTGTAAGLIVPMGQQGELNLHTVELLSYLQNEASKTVSLEIEYTGPDSKRKTLLQLDCILHKDVVPNSNPQVAGIPENLAVTYVRQSPYPTLAALGAAGLTVKEARGGIYQLTTGDLYVLAEGATSTAAGNWVRIGNSRTAAQTIGVILTNSSAQLTLYTIYSEVGGSPKVLNLYDSGSGTYTALVYDAPSVTQIDINDVWISGSLHFTDFQNLQTLNLYAIGMVYEICLENLFLLGNFYLDCYGASAPSIHFLGNYALTTVNISGIGDAIYTLPTGAEPYVTSLSISGWWMSTLYITQAWTALKTISLECAGALGGFAFESYLFPAVESVTAYDSLAESGMTFDSGNVIKSYVANFPAATAIEFTYLSNLESLSMTVPSLLAAPTSLDNLPSLKSFISTDGFLGSIQLDLSGSPLLETIYITDGSLTVLPILPTSCPLTSYNIAAASLTARPNLTAYAATLTEIALTTGAGSGGVNLTGMTALESLTLNGLSMGANQLNLTDCDSLTQISLVNCTFSVWPNFTLAPTLTQITVGGAGTPATWPTLTGLTSLLYFNGSSSGITARPVITGLTALEKFIMNGTSISDAPAISNGSHPLLYSIGLNNCPNISIAEVDTFYNALPTATPRNNGNVNTGGTTGSASAASATARTTLTSAPRLWSVTI